jgi:mono/diheme cytochrome c family protein
MKARWNLALAGGVLLAAAVALVGALRSEPDMSAQAALGRDLYALHCAACHGENLEGQPDWQTPLQDGRMPAPPLDGSGHAPHHARAELFRVVKEGMAAVGGKPSDMPPFGDILTDAEIDAVLAFIETHW